MDTTMPAAAPGPILAFGLTPTDLAHRDGLIRLDRLFLARLAAEDAGLHASLLAARAAPAALAAKAEAELVAALGPPLEAFVAALFGIEAEIAALAEATRRLDPIHQCKRLFVQRQAVKKYPDPAGFDGPALGAALEARIGGPLGERAFATHVDQWQANDPAALDLAMRYAAWRAHPHRFHHEPA